jgi:hypothetical protein
LQLARIHPVQARKAPTQVKRSDVCDGGDWMIRSACGAQRNTPALISAFSEKNDGEILITTSKFSPMN